MEKISPASQQLFKHLIKKKECFTHFKLLPQFSVSVSVVVLNRTTLSDSGPGGTAPEGRRMEHCTVRDPG